MARVVAVRYSLSTGLRQGHHRYLLRVPLSLAGDDVSMIRHVPLGFADGALIPPGSTEWFDRTPQGTLEAPAPVLSPDREASTDHTALARLRSAPDNRQPAISNQHRRRVGRWEVGGQGNAGGCGGGSISDSRPSYRLFFIFASFRTAVATQPAHRLQGSPGQGKSLRRIIGRTATDDSAVS
ncbi:hypothetical protein CPLU01_06444 [Colletotrichum plurivorum]|uniref:Uncharacterized protein n=1 Tax=Colletotrichum plurivorum TaxID=2175906 RepID=A0A8H6KHX7_9PEZI|nr:hypothetical protein CPLU01_06444 [Colletotrichum plurivorum]